MFEITYSTISYIHFELRDFDTHDKILCLRKMNFPKKNVNMLDERHKSEQVNVVKQ